MAELEKLRVKALGLLNNCRDNIASKEASAAIRSQMVGILGDLKKYQGEEKFSLNEITERIQTYIIEFMKDELKRLKSDAEAQIRICIDEKELQDTKVAFLGKRGKLNVYSPRDERFIRIGTPCYGSSCQYNQGNG